MSDQDLSEKKAFLREQARKHLAAEDVLAEHVEHAAEHFFNGLDLSGDEVIAGYWPKGREFDCTPILEEALKRGHVCALPVVEQNSKVLTFLKWDKETRLEKSSFGIMEPRETPALRPDIVIVPLLAFDSKGTRLGQGGGYYDATLSHLKAAENVVAVGTGYAAQAVLFALPKEEHDERMDYILTPIELRSV